MSVKKISRLVSIGLVIGFLFFGANARAQKMSPTVAISVVPMGERTAIQTTLGKELRTNLQEKSWVKLVDYDENPEYVVVFHLNRPLVNAQHAGILTVAVEQPFPAPWLDYLAQQEIPYKLLPALHKKELPPEGRFVRRYVTKELFRNYRHLLSLNAYLWNQKNLSAVAKQASRDVFAVLSQSNRLPKSKMK